MKYMPHREPRKSPELQILSHLNSRMDLSPHDKKNLHNLEKGYEGEWKFFHLLEKELHSKCIRLFSLQLESNQTEFQIDNLLIYQNTIHINEIKNFEGDFFIKDDMWYAVDSRKEIRNPMLQLQRSEFLLRQLLQQIGVNFQVVARLVFVNPSFTLYQALFEKALVFPTQLNRYMQKLNKIPSKLTTRHGEFAEDLIARHFENSLRERLPEYDYNQLQKGVICSSCNGLMSMFNKIRLRCKRCSKKENIKEAVMRSVREFNLLFPNQQITTNIIYDWCNVVSSKKTIRRILIENMVHVGNGRGSYYIFQTK